MTIDVNLCRADETFLADIEEIMEESMVQMFILHPKTISEIEEAQEIADEYESIFYSVPLSLQDNASSKCVAYSIRSEGESMLLPIEKPIVIEAELLNDAMITKLSGSRGIILNPTQEYTSLEGFYLAMGSGNVGAFETEVLSQMSMDKIVLQSTYPSHGFEEIMECVKVISNAMFRPEQSIIARATKSSLELFGFRKR
ncbi:MAG: hypothetical protein A2552_08060 [Sulfuricurvum sp. RIFOXYD2_FULL_44_160]|uniref:Uncharacterized protein n=1 Tax=Sulfuricurvum kujiense TaxID=148813 RepID=A0A2D3WMR4_9BACT|nr:MULTISPECIES: hypothetical protein [Sulfuricurvum]OHD92812.1 MAG: hypothetical protein A2517_04710 [Sulfuricurvum sp. RIFOXYD12_FULL_44_77]OHD96578.1 MAG: hypothetical protein A2552_08060 [Sulfuricurvum sp. RIFOXYD2_FULL_44_160]DAB37843.1 MAG TPA: hypothetical protein CFH83_09080 [Sulfuricurvum kujiense]